jgi:hypothetical protein
VRDRYIARSKIPLFYAVNILALLRFVLRATWRAWRETLEMKKGTRPYDNQLSWAQTIDIPLALFTP